MGYKVVVILLISSVYLKTIEAIVCSNDFCASVRCARPTCEPHQELRPGGVCSCCDVCYTILNKGQPCNLLHIREPAPVTVVCGENLVCYQNKCQKEKDVVSELSANYNE